MLRARQEVSARYGVLIEKLGIDLRGLFIINPEGVIEQITMNNLGIGRNVDEAKRLVQAIQFVAEHGEVWGLHFVSVPHGSLTPWRHLTLHTLLCQRHFGKTVTEVTTPLTVLNEVKVWLVHGRPSCPWDGTTEQGWLACACCRLLPVTFGAAGSCMRLLCRGMSTIALHVHLGIPADAGTGTAPMIAPAGQQSS